MSGLHTGPIALLQCMVKDWILSSCVGTTEVDNGTTHLTDEEYAVDAVLFTECPSSWPDILANFDSATQTMGLHTSWSKTNVQNLG